MASTPVQKPLPLPPKEGGIEQHFRRVQSQWNADTLVLSDPGKIMAHPAIRGDRCDG
jgi:hypothetical protein